MSDSIAILLLPGRSILALVPLWAVLCGTCMAYVQIEETLDTPRTLLALLLAISVVGVLWSTWRALLVDVDWDRYFQSLPLPAPKLISGLPYATPWSPLGRLAARTNQFRRWSADASLEVRGAWYTLLVLPALILVTSALGGWPLLVLSLAALSLSLIEWRVARRRLRRVVSHTALRAALQVGLGWLAGYALLAPLTWPAVTLACCYAIAYQGALGLGQPSLEPGHRNRALLYLYGGQTAALCQLALLSRPITAAFAAFLLAPQWLLLAGLDTAITLVTNRHPPHKWYLQRALPICMIAMLAAAWAPR